MWRKMCEQVQGIMKEGETHKTVIVAIDSLKGCLSSTEANRAVGQGVALALPTAKVVALPVSDGGEGWLDAFTAAVGGERVALQVCDPLMRPIRAHYLVKGETAIVEMAQASGLMLMKETAPWEATTYGVGQMVADAVERGCRHIVVGLGGSATSDAGMGMLRALVDHFAPGGRWSDIRALSDVRFTIATDVRNPLCGEQGAAHVFGPQKGATAEMVERLDRRAQHFAEVSARHFGYDRQDAPGAGAAGGLGYAFLQYLDAECRPGIDVLLDAIGFDQLLADADLVVTGEGRADRQTLMGKLPVGILQRAMRRSVPVCLLAGQVADRKQLLAAGFSRVECFNPPTSPLAECMKGKVASARLSSAIARLLPQMLGRREG